MKCIHLHNKGEILTRKKNLHRYDQQELLVDGSWALAPPLLPVRMGAAVVEMAIPAVVESDVMVLHTVWQHHLIEDIQEIPVFHSLSEINII